MVCSMARSVVEKSQAGREGEVGRKLTFTGHERTGHCWCTSGPDLQKSPSYQLGLWRGTKTCSQPVKCPVPQDRESASDHQIPRWHGLQESHKQGAGSVPAGVLRCPGGKREAGPGPRMQVCMRVRTAPWKECYCWEFGDSASLTHQRFLHFGNKGLLDLKCPGTRPVFYSSKQLFPHRPCTERMHSKHLMNRPGEAGSLCWLICRKVC